MKRRGGMLDGKGWDEMTEESRNSIFSEVNKYLALRFGVVVRKVKLLWKRAEPFTAAVAPRKCSVPVKSMVTSMSSLLMIPS